MAIEQELRKQLAEALRARDQRTADIVRMILTKVTERRTAAGFSGTVDDPLYLDVIAAYRKSLQKARAEYLAAGERGAEHAAALLWEIDYCGQFLPTGLSTDDLHAAVRAAIAKTGAADARMVGRVVGEVMKEHKGRVEASEVKRIAEQVLAGS